MRHPYPVHGRTWSIWHPLRWSCRCGQGAYPCWVEKTWRRFDGLPPTEEAWLLEQRRERGPK